MPPPPRPPPPPPPVPPLLGRRSGWSGAPATRRAATRDRRRAAGGASLARGHGPYAGLMEQRDHHLVVQPLGSAQREFDHEVHVFATARLPLDLERSEEHTSELQSRLHLVCRLLLEKK